MGQATPSTQRAVAAAKYGAGQAMLDPIQPLADGVARGIRDALVEVGSSASLLEEVTCRLPALIAKALQESLTQHSAKGKALRMALITKLASDEMTPLADAALAQQAGDPASLLSTAEAARILGMSRPYVTMLCDSGKLGPIETTDGGHRRIPRDALERYRAQSSAQYKDAPTVREAGLEAHLYDHDDGHFSNVVRGLDAEMSSTSKSKSPTKARP